ncbi:hypothetical protein C1H76_1839 [Elsinoe australis]|uniref:Uncharacterized protein n=1 Tax=Elsinoe australis TaxID=40998 RepID=A0A4V6DW03_9PEZI|nr:hypothetical protein C1H76_1839 [Elsinoe australis]
MAEQIITIDRLDQIKRSRPVDHRDNTATQLRNQLTQDGITQWGLRIYRCTDGDDEAWQRFMDFFRERSTVHLRRLSAADLSSTLVWDVQEDASTLDGTSKAVVRDLYRQWVTQATGGIDPASREALNPRYRFCVHVDEESLRSVLQYLDTRDSRVFEEGFVNLVQLEWIPELHDPELGEEEDEELELEGLRLWDVGWLKTGLEYLYPSTYELLYADEAWELLYQRPPEIAMP